MCILTLVANPLTNWQLIGVQLPVPVPNPLPGLRLAGIYGQGYILSVQPQPGQFSGYNLAADSVESRIVCGQPIEEGVDATGAKQLWQSCMKLPAVQSGSCQQLCCAMRDLYLTDDQHMKSECRSGTCGRAIGGTKSAMLRLKILIAICTALCICQMHAHHAPFTCPTKS